MTRTFILVILFFVIALSHSIAQFPTEKDFGVIVSKEATLYTLPKTESTKVAVILFGTTVYAIQQEIDLGTAFLGNSEIWCVVKTGSGQMGYVLHSDVALFTQKDYQGEKNIAGESYTAWIAYTKTNPYKEEDGESIPFLIDKNKKIQFLKTLPVGELGGYGESIVKATCMFDMRSWVEFGSDDVKIKYEFSQTDESGEYKYRLYKTNAGEIYAMLESDQKTGDAKFVVAESKTAVVGSDGQPIDYMEQWEVAARNQETNNCYTQILTHNFKTGYVYRTVYCGTNNVSFFSKKEGYQMAIGNKICDLVVSQRIDNSEESRFNILLINGALAQPIHANSPSGHSNLFNNQVMEFSTYNDGGEAMEVLAYPIFITRESQQLLLKIRWFEGESGGESLHYYDLQESSGKIYATEIVSKMQKVEFRY